MKVKAILFKIRNTTKITFSINMISRVVCINIQFKTSSNCPYTIRSIFAPKRDIIKFRKIYSC